MCSILPLLATYDSICRNPAIYLYWRAAVLQIFNKFAVLHYAVSGVAEYNRITFRAAGEALTERMVCPPVNLADTTASTCTST